MPSGFCKVALGALRVWFTPSGMRSLPDGRADHTERPVTPSAQSGRPSDGLTPLMRRHSSGNLSSTDSGTLPVNGQSLARFSNEGQPPEVLKPTDPSFGLSVPSINGRRVCAGFERIPRHGEGSHYLALAPGFEILEEGRYVAPTLYQPTPAGLSLLVEAHLCNNEVDFRVHEKRPETGESLFNRVQEFMGSSDLGKLAPNHPIAVILLNGQMHAIPLFFAVRKEQKYLLILDSTSGPVQQQYWTVAKSFPDFEVRLNAGTRQADSQSCINDAFEVLKQCFTLGNLIDLVEDRRCGRKSAVSGNSLLKVERSTKPDNFSLFNLPEELAFVAQRATFLQESGLDMSKPITVEGRTCSLGMHVTISTDFGRKVRELPVGYEFESIQANTYLYQASERHRAIIEQYLTKGDHE